MGARSSKKIETEINRQRYSWMSKRLNGKINKKAYLAQLFLNNPR